ncbi:RNA methyltransferase [Candidatus Babeliales bacterium]|nr:RNA methyltransferase [Candidatus Babeliales bacterium]
MNEQEKKVLQYFSHRVTPQRLKKIEQLLPLRTRHVAVVLEDVYQSHNAGAALRSCDAFGVQDVHCILGRNEFDIDVKMSKGAAQWLDISYYSQEPEEISSPTQHCVETLKRDGYKIIATSPHATTSLHDLKIDEKLAFMFGTEDEGLTEEAIKMADETIKIPMYGFVESFNVSVSIALILFDITTRLRASEVDWKLSDDEQKELKLDWLRNSIDRSELLEKRFLEDLSK